MIDWLTDEQIKLLLKVCSGRDFMARRDEATVRLLAECGLRAGELVALKTTDVDLEHGLVTVTRGKGGKGRVVAIGAHTKASLDRYLRSRRMHRLAATEPLFYGVVVIRRTSVTTAYVLRCGRGQSWPVSRVFTFHRLLHSFASGWLASGGTEGGLMSAAGGHQTLFPAREVNWYVPVCVSSAHGAAQTV